MNEQAVFLAALDIVDPAERAAYVKRTCAGDPTLLRHVEALLAAHERSGEFLDVPALRQITAGASEDRPSLDETQMECSDIKEEVDLSFLLPSTQPGSLGRLGHYEVQEVIGRGGCGVVLKAFDDILHRLVAIKVMTPEMAATSPARKRFLREARAAASIRHENVVSIHAVEEKPIPFLVMEYIAGQTLQQKLDQNGPLDVEEVVQIGQQIASGLEAAHAIGLIHRDIKPGNILLDKGRDRIKITDFGLARATDDASITQSGVIAGTPLYMSPEQAHGAAIDHRSDLFSLGSVLYVMCSGRPPFRAATTLAVLKRVAEDEPRPIQEIIPEVPEWLIAIISRLLAKKPADRFTSAQEVSNLLARFLSEMQHRGRVESLGDVLPMMPKPAIEVREPVPVANPITPEPRMPAPEKRPVHSRNRRWAMAAALFLTVFAGIGMTEATGVTNVRGTVIRLFSPDGTLVVEVDDPGVSVSIDGADMVITGAGAKEIRLKPGQYKVLTHKDGEIVRQELVTVTRNGRRVVRVSKEAGGVEGTAAVPRVHHDANTSGQYLFATGPTPAIYVHRLPGNDGGPQAGQVTAEQRKALEWVLSAGGTIYLQSGGKLLNFHQGDRLPDDPFKTVQVFLQDIDASSAVDDVSIENLKALPNFDLLKLVSSRVSDVGLARLATYPWFANLDHLGLNDTPLSDAGLAHVKNCKRLNWLTLSNVPVTGGGLAHLRGLPLSTLWIQGCRRVGDDAADILADIPTLTGLDLQGTAITPAGIAKLSRLPGLQSLFVSGDAVTDDLAAVARLQGLTGLRIDSLTVTDAGLARLTTLPELKHLIFTESKAVTDAAVDHIAKCKNLRTFNVKRCGITQAGVKKLAALRPDLKIEWDGGVIEPAPASSVIGQHKALQWVLEDRGSRHTSYLTLKAKEKVMHLMTGNEVPDGPVEVIQVSLSGLQQADSHTAIENLTRLFSPDFRFHNSPGIEDEVLAALANHPNTKNVTNFHMNTIGVTASGFAHIRKFSNLRTLGVGLAPVSARELAQLRELPLTSLTVFACKEVNDDAIAEVATYPALKTLALAGLPLTDRSLEHLAKCKTLGLLTFARMTFSEAARKKLIAALPGCKITWDGTVEPTVAADPDRRAAEYVLSMGGGVTIQSAGRDQSVQNAGELPSGAFQLTAAGWARVNDQVDDAGLAHFEGCKNLTSIIVLSRRVTDNGMVYFKDCKKLSTLWLLGTQVTDAGLVHFKDCKELAKLHLAGSSGITDAGLAYFKDLKLQGLHLDETKVSDAGLAILVDPESLESLGLGNTRVSGAGLAFLKDCRNLSNLDLRKTKVTDAEMSHFKDCQKLTNIVLNDTEVGDSGLAHLRDCKVIRTLHLQGTPLTDVGVDTLKGFPQLTHVWLNRTKATAAGIAGLQKALPGCRIHWDGGVIEPTGSTSGKQ